MSKLKLLKVRKEGGSYVLTVTALIPRTWAYVRAAIESKTRDSIIIKITKVGD